MSSNEDFFATKRAAAVFKHGILKRYPVVFASKTGRNVEDHRVVFLDGYAGRGEYDDGSPGSPLLLCRSAEFVEKYRNVLGIFVEQDNDNFANLKRVLDAEPGLTRKVLLHGSLDQHLATALSMARDASLFAFLDPFGPALDGKLIKSDLLGRPSWPRTEVLLHFSLSSVARLGSAVRAAKVAHGELRPADRKTARRLTTFLGGDWWQEHFADVTSRTDERRATDVAMDVAERYSSIMATGTPFRAIRMPIRPRPDLMPKYVLVLFTQSSEGAWCFADSVGRAGVEWNGAWIAERTAGQYTLFQAMDMPLFDPKEYERDRREGWVREIAKNIDMLLSQGHEFSLADRVLDVYGPTLGSAWDRHVKEAVKRLYSDGRISNPGTTKTYYRDVNRRPKQESAA